MIAQKIYPAKPSKRLTRNYKFPFHLTSLLSDREAETFLGLWLGVGWMNLTFHCAIGPHSFLISLKNQHGSLLKLSPSRCSDSTADAVFRALFMQALMRRLRSRDGTCSAQWRKASSSSWNVDHPGLFMLPHGWGPPTLSHNDQWGTSGLHRVGYLLNCFVTAGVEAHVINKYLKCFWTLK